MKLYEINERVEDLLLMLEPDPETGEVAADADSIIEELEALELERIEIVKYLAKLVINLRSDTACIKAEEQRLKEHRLLKEKKEEKLLEIIDRECKGNKTDLGFATVNYRSTSKVEISDGAMAVDWLQKQNRDDCLRYSEPEISKSDVKRLLQSGTEIPGIKLVQGLSCSLK